MVESERAYWQHAKTGEVWAVETEAGRPVRCAGPIEPRYAEAIVLPYLPYSRVDIQVILPQWPLFFRRELCPLCAEVMLPGASAAAVPRNGRAANRVRKRIANPSLWIAGKRPKGPSLLTRDAIARSTEGQSRTWSLMPRDFPAILRFAAFGSRARSRMRANARAYPSPRSHGAVIPV